MSGLPSGYTQLEYIQSSGTQYVDTGVRQNQNSRVVVDFQLVSAPAGSYAWIFEGRDTGPKNRHSVYATKSNGNWYGGYGSASKNTNIPYDLSVRITADFNKNVLKIGNTSITFAQEVFQSSTSTVLFGCSTGGTIAHYAQAKLFGCRFFDGDTLLRDFVPCKNASGAVGLYDTVGAQFYANAGTGTFTAGPEVVYEPDAPTNFAASVSGQTVALSWAASANAAGYRLKRDGVQIADQTGTTYTDTVPDGTTICTYALTAYNDAGESAAVTLLVLVQLELITDRTRADVENETDKGFYNASDLNRVGAAVEYIAGRFTALGYPCPVTVKKDWLTTDAPTASQMEAYRQNIVTLRGQIAVMQSTPDAPASMEGLNYVKANNIEQILLDLDALITNITKSWYFAGELYAGEV